MLDAWYVKIAKLWIEIISELNWGSCSCPLSSFRVTVLCISCGMMCIASRNVSAAVNSSIQFNCSSECKSDIKWSYVSPALSAPQHTNHTLLISPCLTEQRCQVLANTAMPRRSLLIDQVQFRDAGTYLCSSGIKNKAEYCEMSFTFTGNFIRIPMHAYIRLQYFRMGLSSVTLYGE